MMRKLMWFVLLAGFAPLLHAATVAKVKGHNVLITIEGESMAPGELYYALSGNKKKAKLRIARVDGARAIAKITTGVAAPGMTLIRASSVKSAGSGSGRGGRSSSHPSSATPDPHQRAYWGVILGYTQDTMSVNVNNYLPPGNSLGSVALSGSGFALAGLFDYEMFNQIWFRGTAGIETFNAAGSTKCGVNNAQPCNAQIDYLAFDFIARYVFSHGNLRPWLGAGVGLLFPASKKATALESGSIGTTNVILVEGGLDWFITPRFYIPISLEYGLLPKSDQVDAHWIGGPRGNWDAVLGTAFKRFSHEIGSATERSRAIYSAASRRSSRAPSANLKATANHKSSQYPYK